MSHSSKFVVHITVQANNFKVFEAHMALPLPFELTAENGSKKLK